MSLSKAVSGLTSLCNWFRSSPFLSTSTFLDNLWFIICDAFSMWGSTCRVLYLFHAIVCFFRTFKISDRLLFPADKLVTMAVSISSSVRDFRNLFFFFFWAVVSWYLQRTRELLKLFALLRETTTDRKQQPLKIDLFSKTSRHSMPRPQ